eukprot:3875095-Amphidinium_carterae.2
MAAMPRHCQNLPLERSPAPGQGARVSDCEQRHYWPSLWQPWPHLPLIRPPVPGQGARASDCKQRHYVLALSIATLASEAQLALYTGPLPSLPTWNPHQAEGTRL